MKRLVQTAAATAIFCMLAAPAWAATQWNFEASLQYKTFWSQRNWGDHADENGFDREGGGRGGLKRDGYLDWTTQGDSYVAMAMTSDHLEGYIEMQYDTENNQVKPNYFWGRYNFNENLGLLIGQTDPLFIQEISNQVFDDNANLNGIGTLNSDTLSMIALTYQGFAFALAKPVKEVDDLFDANADFFYFYSGNALEDVTADIDTYLPQLHASYEYEADTWRIKFGGAFASYRFKKITFDDGLNEFYGGSKTVNSWLLGLDGEVFFGPLSLAAAASYGQNWGLAGWNLADNVSNAGFPIFRMNTSGNSFKVKDTDTLMLSVVGAYQLTEELRFELGAGYRRDDNSMFDAASDTWLVYLQAAYEVAPGFTVIPEVGYYDYGKHTGGRWNGMRVSNNKTEGNLWYAGAQWRMDF